MLADSDWEPRKAQALNPKGPKPLDERTGTKPKTVTDRQDLDRLVPCA